MCSILGLDFAASRVFAVHERRMVWSIPFAHLFR
jgi:hypothetical protein